MINGPAQHSGIQEEVRNLVIQKIESLEQAGYAHEAMQLKRILEYAGYPEGYR
jgi:hypothetical protein